MSFQGELLLYFRRAKDCLYVGKMGATHCFFDQPDNQLYRLPHIQCHRRKNRVYQYINNSEELHNFARTQRLSIKKNIMIQLHPSPTDHHTKFLHPQQHQQQKNLRGPSKKKQYRVAHKHLERPLQLAYPRPQKRGGPELHIQGSRTHQWGRVGCNEVCWGWGWELIYRCVTT